MVDPSLLRLAADRGVTICFADLDGADGLWVPEERTVLVNRALSEREVAEVIEHELGHVAIDDQHSDLDAGVVRRPPAQSRAWAAALTAAACVALIGGVAVGMANREQATVLPEPVVAPSPPPLTGPAGPALTVVSTFGPDGQVVYRTVTPAPRPATAPVSVSGSPAGSAARSGAPVTRRPGATPVPPARTTNQPAPTPAPTSVPPTTAPPTPEPTTPAATSPASGLTQDAGTG